MKNSIKYQRHRTIRAILLLCLFSILSYCSAPPKIDFKEKEHNLGRLYQGTWIDHVFKFTNTGESTLKIKRVGAS